MTGFTVVYLKLTIPNYVFMRSSLRISRFCKLYNYRVSSQKRLNRTVTLIKFNNQYLSTKN